ncbi:hypothetical protein Bbelb_237360 [Branchiostoma belcheri]|nr:hypothetical protein Bbelb_237360 [Branchiostoma belcheri]
MTIDPAASTEAFAHVHSNGLIILHGTNSGALRLASHCHRIKSSALYLLTAPSDVENNMLDMYAAWTLENIQMTAGNPEFEHAFYSNDVISNMVEHDSGSKHVCGNRADTRPNSNMNISLGRLNPTEGTVVGIKQQPVAAFCHVVATSEAELTSPAATTELLFLQVMYNRLIQAFKHSNQLLAHRVSCAAPHTFIICPVFVQTASLKTISPEVQSA